MIVECPIGSRASRAPTCCSTPTIPWTGIRGARRRSRRRARRGKPIFLSIGYATCHWCHVMERESFENAGVADVLNDHVHVDQGRSRRAARRRSRLHDVRAGHDRVRRLADERVADAGLQPFYGGTYFPPAVAVGPARVSSTCSTEIGRAWREDRAEGRASRRRRSSTGWRCWRSGQDDRRAPGETALTNTFQQFQQSFDTRRGGFGDAPKFPRPSELLFLLREYARTGNDAARDMVVQTLRAMALGGMRDHIGGGFHRYSVDGNWRVPHFEKMLYDQAQLVLACLEASQAGDDPFFAQIAEDTLQYVRRDMTDDARRLLFGGGCRQHPAGTTRPQDLKTSRRAHKDGRRLLHLDGRRDSRRCSATTAPIFEGRYGMLPNGNAPFDPQQEFVEQEPAVHRAVDRRHRQARRARRRSRSPKSLLRARQMLFDVRELAAAAAAGRQGADRVERPDDRGVRARVARAGRRRAGAGQRRAIRPRAHLQSAIAAAAFIRDTMWNAATRTLAAAVSRRRRGDRRLRRRLRVPDLRRARVVPGHRRSAVAVVGARAAGAAGRAVLGCGRRRLVQHDRHRSVGAGADEGGLRRRRAVADVGVGDEPADAGAPDRRARLRRRARPRRSRRSAGGSRSRAARCRSWRRRCRRRIAGRRADRDRRSRAMRRTPRRCGRRRTRSTGRSR